MAEFLDENFGAETSPVDLDSFIQSTPLPPITLPEAATRNRAATTALLSDPSQAVDNYQLMMAEAQNGDATLLKSVQEGIHQSTTTNDIKGVMSVLSDPKLPLEMKQKALEGVRSSQFLKDTTNTLYTNALQNPSKGENIEQEDARISSAEAIGEIYQARQDIQGLVNGFAASLPDASFETATDMAAVWVLPFGNNISTGKVAGGLKEGTKESIWQTIKRYSLAGSTTADLRERLASIPPEKRAEFSKSLLTTIQNNSGIIFSNDNHFAQYDKASTIFDEGGYSSTQEFLDNISPLLDIVGFGQALRGGSKVAKVVSKGEEVAPALDPLARPATAPTRAPSVTAKGDLATISGKPTGGSLDARIAALEDEKAGLLGTAGNQLDKGQVAAIRKELDSLPTPKNKYERADQAATRTRLEGQLSQNAEASTAMQKIVALEKQIDELNKRNAPIFLQKTKLADAIERIELNAVVRLENPAAPGNVIGSANPAQARNIFETVMSTDQEEVARAMYGNDKVQAIASQIVPQVITDTGSVIAKTFDIQQNLREKLQVPDILVNTINNIGANNYTNKEKAQARAQVVNDFSAAEGLTVNDAMSSFRLDGGRIEIGAVYGTADGSFLRSEDAFNQAKLALRSYGVRDDEIQILKRDGLDYTPVDRKSVAGIDGDYLVKINTSHEIDPTDVGRFDELDVKLNWFDRISPLVSNSKGSASRHILDAASMLHPQITGAASVASDQTARLDKILIDIATEFSNKFTKLPAARRAKVDEYIKEANYNGIKFDNADLVARGFTAPEIEALRAWRNFWDGHFYLENYDLVRTLNTQGFQLFDNGTTRLYAKPIAKNQNVGSLYDPATDSIVAHTKIEGDTLYNAGGTYAKLRRPVSINGSNADYMIVRNTPHEYVRKFRDSDEVLNYREGYFQIQYKAPRFVEQQIRTPSGDPDYVKTIAVAGDTAEAEAFASRMASTQGLPREDFRVRGDARAMRKEDDAYWDLQSASGRIAQRHRGKLLEDGSGLNHLGDGSYIVNPVDSATRAAASIAGRTVSRPMLEAAKARFIQQYGDMLPPNQVGGKRWPNSVGEISLKGKETSKQVADARTTYEYINYLENGYINSADEVFKAGFNAMADMLGKYNLPTLERGALNISERSPSSLAKRGVFNAYIGSNFLRQLIVQPHQVIRTFSYNPRGWLGGSIEKKLGGYVGSVMGVTPETPFTKFLNESGLFDAVDKSNLVRGTLKDAADASNVVTKNLTKIPNALRRIGFDMGEQANLLGHAAAVFDMYERRGLNLADKAVRDAAYSEIRAISYDMNFAGDFPYNQNSAAMVLQFMQVPHKAFLQMTNRRIPADVRARMVATDIVLWGGPTALVSYALGGDILPENPELRETFLFGLESMLYNHMFRQFFDTEGEHTSVDFSAFAPYDTRGWQKFFEGVFSGGLTQLVTNSPAGQLFLKEGSRVQNAIAAMGRYFGFVEDFDEDPETFANVMDEVAKVASVYNNAVKGKIMLDAKKKYDQYGVAIDKSTTTVEAWAQMLGFSTADSRDFYEASISMSKDIKAHKEEVMTVYNGTKRYYYDKLNVENTDPIFITKVTGRILKIYENDPVAQAIILGQLKSDLQGADAALLNLFMTRSGIPTIGRLKDQVKQMPVSEAEKQMMMQRIDDVASIRQSNDEKRK
jgi:hypothetical protein